MFKIAWRYPRANNLPAPPVALKYRCLYYNDSDDFSTAKLYSAYPPPIERANVVNLEDGKTYFFWLADVNLDNVRGYPSDYSYGVYVDCCKHGGGDVPDPDGNCDGTGDNPNCADIILVMPLHDPILKDLSDDMRTVLPNGSGVQIKIGLGQWQCNALEIPATTQHYVDIDALDGKFNADADFTARAQVKIVDPTGAARIIFDARGDGRNKGWVLFVENSELVLMLATTGWYNLKLTGPFTAVDQWVEVAMSRTGDTWRIFVGGVMVGQQDSTGYLLPDQNRFRIGADPYGQSNLGGLIDDIEIMRKSILTADYTVADKPVAGCSEGVPDPEDPDEPIPDPDPEIFSAAVPQHFHQIVAGAFTMELDGGAHIVRMTNDLVNINVNVPTGGSGYWAELYIEAPVWGTFIATIPAGWTHVAGDARKSIPLNKGDPGVMIALWTDPGSTTIKYSAVIPEVIL